MHVEKANRLIEIIREKKGKIENIFVIYKSRFCMHI